MVSFSLAFYIVLRPQGIRKQYKTLRKTTPCALALMAKKGFNIKKMGLPNYKPGQNSVNVEANF